MDDSLTRAWFPVVPLASEIQFAAGEAFRFPTVESRFILLCRAGQGRVVVNGEAFDIATGDGLVLPWRHDIRYLADDRDPYLIVGAHVIPEHDRGRPVVATVPHRPQDDLIGCGWRRDGGPIPSTAGVVRTSAAGSPGLARLAAHSAEVFERNRPDAAVMEALGVLVLRELAQVMAPKAPTYGNLSEEVSRVLRYVDRRLADHLSAVQLAEVAGCSQATLSRRFRAELGASPLEWVAARRVEEAQRLLRTTHLTIAQVAARCGVPDPYYFSRLFRRHTGTAPSLWRQQAVM